MIHAEIEKLKTRQTSTFASEVILADPANEPFARGSTVSDKSGNVNSQHGTNTWINGVVKNIIPHSAMVCVHSVEHSLGYEVVYTTSSGVPQAFLDAITTSCNNVRSKLFSRLMSSEGMIYLNANSLASTDSDCLVEFWLAGYSNLVGYFHRSDGEYSRITNVIFFQVEKTDLRDFIALKQTMIPPLHAILSNIEVLSAQGNIQQLIPLRPEVNAKERTIIALVVKGKSNKEIARELGMNERTAKQCISNLMLKFNVENRTALAVQLYKMFYQDI
jgi:DNA-binding CsgD family transcriptional regulator